MSRIMQFSIALAFAASAAVTGTAQVVTDGPYSPREWKDSLAASITLKLQPPTSQIGNTKFGKGALTISRKNGQILIGETSAPYTEVDKSVETLGKRTFTFEKVANTNGTKAYRVVAYFLDRPAKPDGTQKDDRMVISITCIQSGSRSGGNCEIHYEIRRCCGQGRDRCGRPCRIEYDICVPVRKFTFGDNACDPDDELLMESP